jgi:hypothetical protein
MNDIVPAFQDMVSRLDGDTMGASGDDIVPASVVDLFRSERDIYALDQELAKLPQIDCKVQNDFSHGIYIRTLEIPKDSLIIGKRHRFETCNILLKGKISIYLDGEDRIVHMEAPCIFNSRPGVKKMGYTHEDTLFANIHPTQEQDIDEIEKLFIISEEEYMEAQKCLGEQ